MESPEGPGSPAPSQRELTGEENCGTGLCGCGNIKFDIYLTFRSLPPVGPSQSQSSPAAERLQQDAMERSPASRSPASKSSSSSSDDDEDEHQGALRKIRSSVAQIKVRMSFSCLKQIRVIQEPERNIIHHWCPTTRV